MTCLVGRKEFNVPSSDEVVAEFLAWKTSIIITIQSIVARSNAILCTLGKAALF